MSISLYDVSIPVFTLSLNNLSAILDKAESHGEAKKVDPKVIPQARLIARYAAADFPGTDCLRYRENPSGMGKSRLLSPTSLSAIVVLRA
jgi:Domain of unknown function (DUF1993)